MKQGLEAIVEAKKIDLKKFNATKRENRKSMYMQKNYKNVKFYGTGS